jgi:hypothetical protein
VLAAGRAAAAAGGELGVAAIFAEDGGGGDEYGGGGGGTARDLAGGGGGGGACSVRLYRSAGGAYDAAQLAAAAAGASASHTHPDDDQEGDWTTTDDLSGPASVIMCQVLASPAAAAAWERVAPRRKPGSASGGGGGGGGGGAAADAVLSALFPVADVCPQYVVHLERAPQPPPKGAETGGALGVDGFHPLEVAGGNLSIQAHVMDLLEAPTVSPRDAAELRALEERVEAEVRQYRYDLWHEMDADVVRGRLSGGGSIKVSVNTCTLVHTSSPAPGCQPVISMRVCVCVCA